MLTLLKGKAAGHRPGRQDHARVQADHKLHVCCGFITTSARSFDVKLTVHSAEFPKDAVHTLESNDHVSVEADQEVKTQ
jgi:hypothetical protein